MSTKQLEQNTARARHSQRTAELSAIIKPLRTAHLDLNAGGTPHAEEEIARVRRLRDTTKEYISHATN